MLAMGLTTGRTTWLLESFVKMVTLVRVSLIGCRLGFALAVGCAVFLFDWNDHFSQLLLMLLVVLSYLFYKVSLSLDGVYDIGK